MTAEERIYRFRCVEAWSMVVPWMGISLKKILEQFEPTGNAKYVEFKTLVRPEEMPGQSSFFSSIDWPYTEGLRMDEAYNPLSIMVTGVFGKELPNQNGAPWRLMVPWKYGFKSVKSIVSIRFTDKEPLTLGSNCRPVSMGFMPTSILRFPIHDGVKPASDVYRVHYSILTAVQRCLSTVTLKRWLTFTRAWTLESSSNQILASLLRVLC